MSGSGSQMILPGYRGDLYIWNSRLTSDQLNSIYTDGPKNIFELSSVPRPMHWCKLNDTKNIVVIWENKATINSVFSESEEYSMLTHILHKNYSLDESYTVYKHTEFNSTRLNEIPIISFITS